MLTRKHLKEITKIFSEEESSPAKDRLVSHFAQWFACQNWRFNVTKFLEACHESKDPESIE